MSIILCDYLQDQAYFYRSIGHGEGEWRSSVVHLETHLRFLLHHIVYYLLCLRTVMKPISRLLLSLHLPPTNPPVR